MPADSLLAAVPSWDNVLRPPTLVSVALEEGEGVQWIWTHYADGRSAVTGYRIVPKLPARLVAR